MNNLAHKNKLNSFLSEINPVIRFLILSDTVFVGALGLLGPIFALFIHDYIIGGNEAVVGIAAGIYLFSRSILQVPIAYFIDKMRGERDDFWFMFIFSIFISVIPLLYLIIHTPIQLYFVQFLLGLFTAFTYPSYMAIFTRHTDKNKEGTEWSFYYTMTDVTGGLLAMVGGYVAITIGFPKLIVLVVILSLLGVSLLLPIKPYLKKK